MALVTRTALFERILPLIQTKRFRGKINVQKPKAPHFIRAAYLELTKPWYISNIKGKPLADLCRFSEERNKKTEEDNPLQRIIAKELFECFNTSKLVVFFHQNPMKQEDETKAFIQFKKKNMLFKRYGYKTMEIAIKGTVYEAVLDFYISKNMILFCDEANIKDVMKINKKFPQLIMLAGIMHGKFISKDDLVKFSMIPNIADAQVQLVQTLNSLGSQLVQQLNTHQNSLVSNLEERVKQLQEDK